MTHPTPAGRSKSADTPDRSGSISQFQIVWLDPPTEQPAFPLDHPYVDLVYTPLLGASAVMFLRRVSLLDQGDAALLVDGVAIASELGLRSRDNRPLGHNSPFAKALRRLKRYRLARWLDPYRFALCREVPAVSAECLPSLPVTARRVHDRFVRLK